MTKIIIFVERLKREVFEKEIELEEGQTIEQAVENFTEEYHNGDYHYEFEDYGLEDADLYQQNLSVYDENYDNLLLGKNLDPTPENDHRVKLKKF